MSSSEEISDSDTADSFSVGDFVVYPSHGVGKIIAVETQMLGANKTVLFVINFERTRLTLRVPLLKAKSSGLRKPSPRSTMQAALSMLSTPAAIKRVVWGRRTQEYSSKINSGDPISIAEVVRDLHRQADQKERSHSEKNIYDKALERLIEEVAAVEQIDSAAAVAKLDALLNAT